MLSKRLVLTLSLMLTAASVLGAQMSKLDILNHKEKVFANDSCRKTKTCDLKEVRYVVEDYMVVMIDGEYNLGTRMFAQFETNSVRNLEKYVFVQFVKGCFFSSRIVDGQPVIEFDVRYLRDENNSVLFLFRDWVLDSNSDPVYPSEVSKPRLYWYRWNTVKDSFSTETEKFYGVSKPRLPRLYVVDHPGTAFVVNGRAKNISLEFKICIYREKDVPKKVSQDNIDFAKPTDCFSWHSSFVYNHKTNEYESHSQIVSACR
ncbi:MAG: hypothetical protein AAB799_00495 [Patescibacteria group bacterium]